MDALEVLWKCVKIWIILGKPLLDNITKLPNVDSVRQGQGSMSGDFKYISVQLGGIA